MLTIKAKELRKGDIITTGRVLTVTKVLGDKTGVIGARPQVIVSRKDERGKIVTTPFGENTTVRVMNRD